MAKRNPNKPGSEKTVRDIRRATRRQYSAEEKIRIVLDGLRGEDSVAELCRREGINGEFVDYYNHERYHESLNNLTPADVYYGRGQLTLNRREQVKMNTLAMRRKMHYDNQMKLQTPMSRSVS